MSRVILALIGVILLAVVALALLWLLGQVMVGVGAFVVGTAGVLSRLLWFLIFTGLLSGLVYFVTSAWRPSARSVPPSRGGAVRLDTAASAFTAPGPDAHDAPPASSVSVAVTVAPASAELRPDA